MATLFHGTSIARAGDIVEHGFEVCRREIILCSDADTAHVYAWLDAQKDSSYAIIKTQFAEIRQYKPLYEQLEEVYIAPERLGGLVVESCLVYDMNSGQPVGILKKDDGV